MHENVGRIDRWLRFAVGGGLMLAGTRALSSRSTLTPALLLATGAVILDTAITRVCPLNGALGIDTRSWDDELELLGLGDEAETGGEASGLTATGQGRVRGNGIATAPRPPSDS